MAVVETMSLRGVVRDSALHFEGWLEAIARLACHKALPTCVEIRNAGCANAGDFMAKLHETDDGAYQDMLKARTIEWGHFPTYQPFFHCVSHVIELMIYRIEKKLGSKGGDMHITSAEMAKWIKSAVGNV